MKVLHAYNLTGVTPDSYQKAVAEIASKTAADVLLLEYIMEDEPQQTEFETEVVEEASGYVREMVMDQSLLVPENVMRRDEIFALCGLLVEAIPESCSILQLGSFSGVFAAVASQIGNVRVISDFHEGEEEIFCENIDYPNPRIRYLDQDPVATLRATHDPDQPDAVFIVTYDPDHDVLWPELVRHLKPGVPTIIVCEASCPLMDYLDSRNIFFEKTQPTEGWLALQVTPIYAAEESESANDDD
jgi:hypothetical protein